MDLAARDLAASSPLMEKGGSGEKKTLKVKLDICQYAAVFLAV
jgi:hypothetical protein